jgi:hypothetical protein
VAPSGGPRTASCNADDARARLRIAHAYLDIAQLVLSEDDPAEFLTVASGLAVLAGIAASDAICCLRLGRMHRGQKHSEAGDLLASALPEGKKLAVRLTRLLDVKGASYYGIKVVSATEAKNALRWAKQLVDHAQLEADR